MMSDAVLGLWNIRNINNGSPECHFSETILMIFSLFPSVISIIVIVIPHFLIASNHNVYDRLLIYGSSSLSSVAPFF